MAHVFQKLSFRFTCCFSNSFRIFQLVLYFMAPSHVRYKREYAMNLASTIFDWGNRKINPNFSSGLTLHRTVKLTEIRFKYRAPCFRELIDAIAINEVP